jgi:tol-pal system protein YbgF
MQFKTKLSCLIVLAALSSSVLAEDADPLAQRVDRLERIIKGQGLMNLITRVDQLQNEVQRLNGDNEALRHELKQMQDRQRQMYIDLDERLQQNQTAPAPVTDLAPQVTDTTPAPVAPTTQAPAPTAPQQTATPADAAPVAVENGEAAYQSALQTLRSGQYEQAVKALSTFPEQYPNSVYLPNAYYWQGEAKYVMRQFSEAAALFQIVIDQYPESTKVADAMLKRGFSEIEMGDTERAKQTLQAVMDTYPDSSAARLAKGRLARLN